MTKKTATPDGPHIKLAKALAHPLRVRILAALTDEVMSPTMLADQLHEPLGNVSYHVKTLLEYKCVELVKTEPRRGAVEHFYRSTGKAQTSAVASGVLPLTDFQRDVLTHFIEQRVDAVEEVESRAALKEILKGLKAK